MSFPPFKFIIFMKKENFTKYYSAIKYLEDLANSGKSYQKTNLTGHPNPQIFLVRMQKFLDRIGNPEKGFKVIHITGTSGKGSVSSAVHATLVKKGKKSGLFTSPFVVSTTEKIQVGDKYIDHKSFAKFVEYLKPHIISASEDKHGAPSYFEIILAIAFLYFKQEKCEYVVLEVGLGGRFDATNIIKNPLVTAITNIGLDHMAVLGKTKAKIAFDKAGIIKNGSKFFTTEESQKLLNIFKKECSKAGADFRVLSVKGLSYLERNTLLSGEICKSLGIVESPDELSSVSLPARFEIVEKSPVVIIDGAHNPAKIKSTIFNLKKLKYEKLSLLIAISSDKDVDWIMKFLSPLADRIYVTTFSASGRKFTDPSLLFKLARKYAKKSCRIFSLPDSVAAFKTARKNLTSGDSLLVTGSFYLAGNIRALYCPEDKILKQRNSKI